MAEIALARMTIYRLGSTSGFPSEDANL